MGVRVVVADNDPDVVDLLVTDLRNEGHEVVGTATVGEDAVELCREHAPDVLVVDYRMPPGLDGIEVAEQVAVLDPAPRVVLYTNYRAPDLARRAARVGAAMMTKGNLRGLRRAVSPDRSAPGP